MNDPTEAESKYAGDECNIKITEFPSNSVRPKYADLETEIIQLGISSKHYERTYYKAKTFLRSYAHPKYKTLSDGSLNNKLFDIKISWKKDQLITVNELLVLILVVDYDIIKSALCKCQICHVFNLRRQLFIVINKYGAANFGKHDKLYIPVIKQIQTTGPLVTTGSLTVAEIFTEEQGMIVGIIPQSNCWKTFDASKLSLSSDYQKEVWLIDFVYVPIIQIKTCNVKGSNKQSSVPICKI